MRSAFPEGQPEAFPGLAFVWDQIDSLWNEGQLRHTENDQVVPGEEGA